MIDFIYQYEAVIRLSAFLGGFSLLALWEWATPKRELTQVKFKRWFNNIALVVSSTILVRIVVPTAAVGVAYLAEQNHWGLANYVESPLWLKVLVSFILLDLTIYFQHTLFHVLPVMWRFHRVHHSDLDCDVTTGLRFHPVEIFLSIFIKIAAIVVLGAPVLAVILFELLLNLMSMFTHSNIRLNNSFERVLRWFVVTPDMHRVHHSARENETNSNFGFNLSLWDRLLCTYMAEPKAGHQGMTIGLDHFREPNWQALTGLISMPFSSEVESYAINYRDTKNADALALANELALQYKEKAELASELTSYLDAIGHLAMVSVTDADGCIIEANDKFCEVSGYRREELLGQNHRMLNSGKHPKDFFAKMWSTINSGNIWHGEIFNRRKDGKFYWIEAIIEPIKDADRKVVRYMSIRVDITDRKRQVEEINKANHDLAEVNHQLEQLSRTDALTKIANRRHFDETLEAETRRQSRQGTPLTLMICDIDYFKSYNDSYGHPAGDACLQQVAESINASFSRAGDLVARYGGEEFAVILPNVDKKNGLILAERMRENIVKLALEHNSSSITNVVTLSIGITTLVPDRDTSIPLIIKNADEALYSAKAAGRNNVRYFS